jgi:hypothetical protein
MPNLFVGIEGTVARDNADNHRFRIVADTGLVVTLPLRLSAEPKEKP